MAVKRQTDKDRAVRYENERKYKEYKASREAEKPLLTAPPRNTSRQKLVAFFDKAKSKATPQNFRSAFVIVFAFILFAVIVRYLLDPELPVLSFNWFLSVIQNVPQLSFDWMKFTNIAMGDWGVFNELRDFIFTLWDLIGKPIVFILQGILNILGFVLYFVKQIFLLQGIGG